MSTNDAAVTPRVDAARRHTRDTFCGSYCHMLETAAMARPIKCREISQEPEVSYFKPRAVPLGELEQVSLGLDEVEALRLADVELLYQEEAAAMMRVSRATFGAILKRARHKVADAIVNGKAIEIRGGVYNLRRKR